MTLLCQNLNHIVHLFLSFTPRNKSECYCCTSELNSTINNYGTEMQTQCTMISLRQLINHTNYITNTRYWFDPCLGHNRHIYPWSHSDTYPQQVHNNANLGCTYFHIAKSFTSLTTYCPQSNEVLNIKRLRTVTTKRMLWSIAKRTCQTRWLSCPIHLWEIIYLKNGMWSRHWVSYFAKKYIIW